MNYLLQGLSVKLMRDLEASEGKSYLAYEFMDRDIFDALLEQIKKIPGRRLVDNFGGLLYKHWTFSPEFVSEAIEILENAGCRVKVRGGPDPRKNGSIEEEPPYVEDDYDLFAGYDPLYDPSFLEDEYEPSFNDDDDPLSEDELDASPTGSSSNKDESTQDLGTLPEGQQIPSAIPPGPKSDEAGRLPESQQLHLQEESLPQTESRKRGRSLSRLAIYHSVGETQLPAGYAAPEDVRKLPEEARATAMGNPGGDSKGIMEAYDHMANHIGFLPADRLFASATYNSEEENGIISIEEVKRGTSSTGQTVSLLPEALRPAKLQRTAQNEDPSSQDVIQL